jgi:glycosyltransferase involved in cell wall biosynthesis
MQKAKIFCVPSVTAKSGDSEGFGMVFAEAQAIGLPVISFASGGINEAVIHEKTGFLAQERDWVSLARYINILLDNESIRQKFVLAGRQHIEAKFNLKRNTVVLEEIYSKVLCGHY